MSTTVINDDLSRYDGLDLDDLVFEKIEILNKILSNSPEKTLTVKIENLLEKIKILLEDYSFETTDDFNLIVYCIKLIKEANECEQLFRIYEENNDDLSRYDGLDLDYLVFEKIKILNKILSNSPEETLTVKIENLLEKIKILLEDYSFETTDDFNLIVYCIKLIKEANECEQLFRIYEENISHL
jgi:uncharacterized protein YjgD (DUF1641 family)